MPQPLTLIVNVFKFFDRKDLEIVSTSAKHANRIVRKHFPSKPYRFLKDVTIEIWREEDGLAVALKLSGSQDAENQSSGVLFFDPIKNEWMNGCKFFALEVMRPYLSQFVRFRETELFVNECSYTPDDVTILASISHLWSGRSLWLNVWQLEDPINFPTISYSLHNILTNDAIFSTRCLELYEASRFVFLHNYSRVYTVDVIFYQDLNVIEEHEPLNIGNLLSLIEHKPQFPESKSVFVLDIITFPTRVAEVTDAICKSFSSASTPCPFRLVIIDDESNGGNEEFRFENETTHEVLQLKNVEKDSLFVTKLCEGWDHLLDYNTNPYDKFILIERSRL